MLLLSFCTRGAIAPQLKPGGNALIPRRKWFQLPRRPLIRSYVHLTWRITKKSVVYTSLSGASEFVDFGEKIEFGADPKVNSIIAGLLHLANSSNSVIEVDGSDVFKKRLAKIADLYQLGNRLKGI